jgi:hypothetical protein
MPCALVKGQVLVQSWRRDGVAPLAEIPVSLFLEPGVGSACAEPQWVLEGACEKGMDAGEVTNSVSCEKQIHKNGATFDYLLPDS